MHDRPLRLNARRAGPLVPTDHTGAGRIEAVFSTVFYINLGGELVAIGPGTIDPGPISVTLDCAPLDWRKLGLLVGKKCSIFNKILHIPGHLSITLANADTWAPPRTAPPSHIADLPPNLAPPSEGYGHTLRPGAPPPAEVEAFTRWLETPDTPPPTTLLGRGPGLTPAGDDLLGGTMIALHALNRPDLAQTLWATLAPRAETRTNAISRALLAAAAQGMGSLALHHALNAYFTGKNLAPALASLDKIGHSSGWDAFTGVVLTTRATLATRNAA